ncbi:hypothetical protein [Sanguibacter sp. 25GB23B1]|uniref:hypothetical protein n=1 Tax=unclassified Sanguibacter TaxID=2645534 RepID=UPI0032AF7A49
MASADEIQRIAAAMNSLRPDWRVSSLVTFLTRHHEARAYRDLVIAAVVVASDPTTKTPQLLNAHGAWWSASQTVQGGAGVEPIRFPRCTEPGHSSYRADNCGACRADRVEATSVARQASQEPKVPHQRVREILATAQNSPARHGHLVRQPGPDTRRGPAEVPSHLP